MRRINKILLTLLAATPFASISTAAYCKLTEAAGEEQNSSLHAHLTMRRMVIPSGTLTTTIEDAKQRFSAETGITDEAALDEEFSRQIQLLLDKGLIETDEKLIIAKPPSAW